MFNAFGKIGWLMPLIAITEIVGGLFSITSKTRAVGALVCCQLLGF